MNEREGCLFSSEILAKIRSIPPSSAFLIKEFDKSVLLKGFFPRKRRDWKGGYRFKRASIWASRF